MGEPLRARTMDFNFLVGCWEIIDCGLETAKGDKEGVVGAMFELTSAGDVFWRLPENSLDIPVFGCETYEAVSRGPFLTTLLRFGSYKGHEIEFRIEKYSSDNRIITIHEGLLYLTCRKIESMPNDNMIELPFTLLPALEEGYFADLSIFANNNREFRVHRCILNLCAPSVDWTAEPPPLSGLPESTLGPIIHFLYTHSLPAGVTVQTVKQVLITASNYPGLESLISTCQSYIRNVSLTKELISLVSDMNVLGKKIIDHFRSKSDTEYIQDPATICSAVANAIRDIALAGSKIVLFCDLYNKRKGDFSTKGGHEIIAYTKSRIPIFVSQASTFMHIVKTTFSGLATGERQELAYYLLPEMENIFSTAASVFAMAKEFLETVLLRLGPEDKAKYRLKMRNYKEHMERIHHRKEIGRIQFILQKVENIIHQIQKKRDKFRVLDNEDKIRALTRNLDHFIDRLPFLLLKVEEFAEDLEQKYEWIESQFCFKMGVAKAGELIGSFLENKDCLQVLASTVCNLVQRDGFTQSAIALGVLDSPTNNTGNLAEQAVTSSIAEYPAFNLTEFLTQPPPPRNNPLAKAALQMLRDGVESDMIFEVAGFEESDDEIDEPEGDGSETAEDKTGEQNEETRRKGSEEGTTEEDKETREAEEGDSATAEAGGDNAAAQAGGENAGAEAGGDNVAAEAGGDNAGGEAGGDNAGAEAGEDNAAAQAVGDNAAAEAEGDSEEVVKEKPKKQKEVLRFKAHRAIIAARCSLFKKALLSGMREDIERKIDIHNISHKLFPKFLDYLYTGQFDYSSLAPEQIADMLLIADCYELEPFKQSCEKALKICISDHSVIFFLNLADQYSAKILKDACLTYIAKHPDVVLDCGLFEVMVPHLRTEVYDLVIWGRHKQITASDQAVLLNSTDSSEEEGAAAMIDSDLDSDLDGWQPDRYDPEEHQVPRYDFDPFGPERSEHDRYVPEPERFDDERYRYGVYRSCDYERYELQQCLAPQGNFRYEWAAQELREIVGPRVPKSVLMRIIMAADGDLNRALNYYYSSS